MVIHNKYTQVKAHNQPGKMIGSLSEEDVNRLDRFITTPLHDFSKELLQEWIPPATRHSFRKELEDDQRVILSQKQTIVDLEQKNRRIMLKLNADRQQSQMKEVSTHSKEAVNIFNRIVVALASVQEEAHPLAARISLRKELDDNQKALASQKQTIDDKEKKIRQMLELITRDAGCTLSTSQPFYMQIPKPNQINVNHFEPETFLTKIFRLKRICDLLRPSDQWFIHRGKLSILKTASVDLFYPSEVEGMLNLEINGDSLKVYAQNELDHVYILDRQTAYLWKVEPETCAITKFSLQEPEPSTQTRLFNIAGVFEDKLLLTAAVPAHASQLFAVRIPEQERKEDCMEMIVETASSLLQRLSADDTDELSGKAELRRELAEAKETIASLKGAITAMENDMRRAGMHITPQPVDSNLAHADIRTELADSKRAIISMKESVDALAKTFEEKQDRILGQVRPGF
ncbi:hypothetical protein PRIPAC_91617 [Pristionchus pacificus]|uniref:Uncharacterized protein n=1 Tax=Pristionchus pacificus TaxID=54126 RepID=A0A2A6BPS2_PRIPA|nr:hypothetical protein PRIPAC_91617 [Pristionchus pacificus]|eukprot:PDM67858.1 hypothetical protein PRIPAC_45902 [Pristionchus pacificus]